MSQCPLCGKWHSVVYQTFDGPRCHYCSTVWKERRNTRRRHEEYIRRLIREAERGKDVEPVQALRESRIGRPEVGTGGSRQTGTLAVHNPTTTGGRET